MYHQRIYENIIVAYFTNEITLGDVETFAQDIENMAETRKELFLIALPINISKYPSNLSDLLKAARHLQNTTGTVTRFYTTELSPIMTFMSKIITQLIGIKAKTITSKDTESLFAVVEKDAELFPALQASIKHLNQIKRDVETVAATR